MEIWSGVALIDWSFSQHCEQQKKLPAQAAMVWGEICEMC